MHTARGHQRRRPLFKAISFVPEPDATADQATPVENAQILNEAVGGIAEHASEEMANLLREFASPMEDIIGLKDGTRTSAEFDVDDWKAAGTELVTICGPYMGGSGSQAPSADVAPSSTSADEISAAYPGYPLIVNAAALDYSVANSFGG